jgi:hypothetical protein
MIHLLYLIGFAFFVALTFGVFSNGSLREKVFYGFKIFAQFVLISITLAWIFYFIPG